MGKVFSNLLYLYLILVDLYGGRCIQITRLEVDSPIISGEGGWLRCDWDEEGDQIYTVKWYFGIDEFYRYTPNGKTPVLMFPVSYFSVDKHKSTKGHVYIRDVSLKATGILRCEVSGEAPAFHTVNSVTILSVVDLPDTRPIIQGVQPVYQLHKAVALTCSSPRSKPAASLSFYVNGEPADDTWLHPRAPQVDPETSLETANLKISFKLRPRLLRDGKVLVKCAATLKDLYWESNEAELTVDVPHRASRLEERSSPEASSSSGKSSRSSCDGLSKSLCWSKTLLLIGALLLWL